MVKNYKTQLKEINTFVFDVDGVFTDNIVILSDNGEQLRTANVRDGYAVQLAVKKGLLIAIISGGRSEAVRRRFEGLGVSEVYLGAGKKIDVFKSFLEKHSLLPENVCYMGDDIPDYAVMSHVGLACCPADAASEIKSIAAYISPRNGGAGCVRDVLEQALKVKGMWMDEESLIW
ncbi:MAG: HAD-IIIA family hydrolase [Flavobacteriales bacterium]|nr:HAD-IIIA family hydrolase [Flavobacteriales bacterium]